VPLLHLVVRRYSTTDNGLLIRRQIHDRNLRQKSMYLQMQRFSRPVEALPHPVC